MNRGNLQRIADMLLDIPQEKFSMRYYRGGINRNELPECESIGCVIGHATKLDAENVIENFTAEGFLGNIEINFLSWSEEFAGLDVDSNEWSWCFGGNWIYSDNTVEGARKRILYLLDKGKTPEDYIIGGQEFYDYPHNYANY